MGMLRAIARPLALTAAACGDNAAGPDARAIDAPAPGCDAAFAGNFRDASRTVDNCPRLAPGATVALGFTIPSAMLAAPLVVAIELGSAPVTGAYSSQTIHRWSAVATRVAPAAEPNCLITAGSDATPTGSFALRLDAIDVAAGRAHGSLSIVQYVHAPMFTSCGAVVNETVELTF